MSTPNYAYENILMVKNDVDEWEFDDDILNIQSHFEGYECRDEWGDNRSYPKRHIVEKEIAFYGRKAVFVRITIGSGYYAGMNVDYEIVTKYDGWEEELELSDTDNKKIDQFERKLIRILEGLGYIRLNHVATFSNGEAVYELAN